MSSPQQLNVGVVGVSEYNSLQLVQLLLRCPHLHLACIADSNHAGMVFSQVYPRFWNTFELRIRAVSASDLAEICEVVFLTLPDSEAAKLIPDLLARGCKAIDLSGLYRLRNIDDYRKWYGTDFSKGEDWPSEIHRNTLEKAVYGLPEIYRSQIQSARLVAVPGCHATAGVLAIAPLLRQGFINPDRISIDSKAGISASDRGMSNAGKSWVAMENTLGVDSILQHCQIPEIEQVCSELAGQKVVVQFTSYRVPTVRGLLITVYATLRDPGLVNDDLLTIYNAFYKQSPWVQVLPSGTFPETKWTAATNRCSIGLTLDSRTYQLVVVCAIDNSIKGGAGQAIQCLNIMQGWPETLGLPQSNLYL